MSDLLYNIKRGNFLPGSDEKNNFFSGTDTEELYKKNLITQPEDWYYKNNTIKYNLNKDGYRAPEFSTIDWTESIVVFGCSTTFGVGVHEEDTIPNQLSQLTNRPVINMGVGGSSIMFSFLNSTILKAKCITPKAVVQIWTWYNRSTLFTDKVRHCGTWDNKFGEFSYTWNQSNNPVAYTLLTCNASRQLWQNTNYYETSFFTDTADILGCDWLNANYIDKARDLIHPGRKALSMAAQTIAKKLKL
jgi:hypothetical protein